MSNYSFDFIKKYVWKDIIESTKKREKYNICSIRIFFGISKKLIKSILRKKGRILLTSTVSNLWVFVVSIYQNNQIEEENTPGRLWSSLLVCISSRILIKTPQLNFLVGGWCDLRQYLYLSHLHWHINVQYFIRFFVFRPNNLHLLSYLMIITDTWLRMML